MSRKVEQVLAYLADVDSRFGANAEQYPDLFADSWKELTQCRRQLENALESDELLIPVVGAFSAGKSTLVNRTLGVDYLPVGISPETAIPTELRYATRERVEAVRESGQVEEYSLDEMDKLTSMAGEYEYARLYADNPALRAFSPFVLVDMPGFNSPHDSHNTAILRYLRRGTHYLFLTSVEEGGLHRQEIRRMDEVQDMGRDFSVLITKSDLKPQSDVQELKNYLEDQLSTSFGKEAGCRVTGNDASANLGSAIAGLDQDAILFNLNSDALLNFYFMLDGILNSSIEALGNEQEENLRSLRELQQGLKAIEQEQEESIRKAKAKLAGDKARHILSAVENELRTSIDELARAAATDQDAFGRILSDIVRSRLSREFQATSAELGSRLATDINHAVQISIPAFNLSEDWFSHLVTTIQTQVLDALMGAVGAPASEKKDVGGEVTTSGQMNGDGSASGRLSKLGGMIAAAVPHPVMKVALAILPGIVGMLLDKAAETRKEEQLKDQIANTTIPDVIRQTAPVVDDAMLAISEQIISTISAEFSSVLNEKAEAIESLGKQNEMDSAHRGELLDRLAACKQVNDESVQTLMSVGGLA